MKLRVDNERLQFELVQAQSCISQLRSCMEERQTFKEDTIKEWIKEAKAISRTYYETLIKSAKEENNELEAEIAILEEKYSAEKRARVQAEAKVQYLRDCRKERDDSEESVQDISCDDVTDDTDSENTKYIFSRRAGIPKVQEDHKTNF